MKVNVSYRGMALLLGGILMVAPLTLSGAAAGAAWQDPEPGTDVLLAQEEGEESTPQEKEQDESGDESEQRLRKHQRALQAEIDALRKKLSDSEAALRSFSIEREMSKVREAHERARQALEEANLAERLNDYNRLLVNPDAPLSKFWIGVHCLALSEESREGLEIAEDVSGVVVESVIDDSPAAKAGLRGGDVIIAIGDANISDVSDVIQIVGKSEGKEIQVQLIRDGETQVVELTPAERPAQFAVPQNIELGALQWDWVPQVPGGDVLLGGELPENFKLSITQEGNEPAQIKVRMGDEVYGTTGNELDKLPAEARQALHRALGRLGGGPQMSWRVLRDGQTPDLPEGILERLPPDGRVLRWFQRNADGESGDDAAGEDVEIEIHDTDKDDEMDEVRAELRELREMIKQLRDAVKK